MKFRIVFIICLVLLLKTSISGYAQTTGNKTTDSLKTLLIKQQPKEQFSTLINISNIYAGINLDSSKHYANKAFILSNKLNSDSLKIKALMFLGHTSWESGKYPESIDYFKKSLKISLKNKDSSTIADAYNGLGIVNSKQGHLNTSIDYYFKTLHLYETLNDSLGMAATLLNIAWDYRKLKEFQKSIIYNQKSLQLYNILKDSLHIAMVNNNIAGSLNELGKYTDAISYSKKSKLYLEKLNLVRYTAYPITNLAISYDSLHNYNLAKLSYIKAIELHTINKESFELAFLNSAFANFNYNQKKYHEAELRAKEAIKYAEEVGAIEFIPMAAEILAKTYTRQDKFKGANEYLKLYIKYNDSLLNSEKLKSIAEIETKYQTEKKEKEIQEQRANLAENELKINQKNSQLLGMVILAVMLAILGYLLYKQQKLKNKQIIKEGQLREALVEIESQNKLQEQRLAISRDLHDNIGAQLTFIISSIDNLQYKFKIADNSLTEKLASISTFTHETIYELRDTIWAMNKSGIFLDDLQSRISNFIDKANIISNNTRFDFNINESVTQPLMLSSVQGMNVYRIIQEAVNNALKHASATIIKVSFKMVNSKLQVLIEDDGLGFDFQSTTLGNGLSNMKKRALDIDAELSVKSELGIGTSVVLLL